MLGFDAPYRLLMRTAQTDAPVGRRPFLLLVRQGLLLACPEYNGSITPLLKNTIDWVTRPAGPDEPTLAAFDGKAAGLVAASPGGLRGQAACVSAAGAHTARLPPRGTDLAGNPGRGRAIPPFPVRGHY